MSREHKGGLNGAEGEVSMSKVDSCGSFGKSVIPIFLHNVMLLVCILFLSFVENDCLRFMS